MRGSSQARGITEADRIVFLLLKEAQMLTIQTGHMEEEGGQCSEGHPTRIQKPW